MIGVEAKSGRFVSGERQYSQTYNPVCGKEPAICGTSALASTARRSPHVAGFLRLPRRQDDRIRDSYA